MWNNHIEWEDNKDENHLYENMIDKIWQSRKDNKKGISVVANKM